MKKSADEPIVQDAFILGDSIAENRRRLNSCPAHQFDVSGIDWERGFLPTRFTCMNCDGSLPELSAVEYARGFAAAGGNPETVIEGFGR